MYDNIQDGKDLAKIFNGVSVEVIADEILLRLSIHILAMRYLEKRAFCFIEVIGDNKKMNEEAKTISNSEKEIKMKRVFYKEKKDVRALLLITTCSSSSPSAFVSGFSALFAFVIPVLGSSTPLFASVFAMSMPKLSTPPSATPVPVLESSVSLFLSAMLVPELSTLPFAMPMLVP